MSPGIGECEWLYRSQFDAPAVKTPFYDLEFEGLDTICDVYLVRPCAATQSTHLTLRQNGVLVLSADNMFRSYTVR
jgi:hypothetical protein